MVMATTSADGTPNVTYLSRAHKVDDERIAISNQFMSKTSRNLAANPRASVLLMDPITHDEYRISLVYERTERRGHVFERLRTDIDVLASLTGMQDVFRLRAAERNLAKSGMCGRRVGINDDDSDALLALSRQQRERRAQLAFVM